MVLSWSILPTIVANVWFVQRFITVARVATRTIRHSSHPLDVDVGIATWWLKPNVLSTTRCRTSVARDADLNDVARDKVPSKAVVRLTIVLWRPTWMPGRHRPGVNLATFAKESPLLCHHSSPQQIAQRPFLCRGLHLSFSSPQIRAVGCPTWSDPFVARAPEACLSSAWRTNRLKFGNRSAILAVSSSRLMVLLCPITLPRLRSISTYLYLLCALAYRPPMLGVRRP